jgi:hypothetical protein
MKKLLFILALLGSLSSWAQDQKECIQLTKNIGFQSGAREASKLARRLNVNIVGKCQLYLIQSNETPERIPYKCGKEYLNSFTNGFKKQTEAITNNNTDCSVYLK